MNNETKIGGRSLGYLKFKIGSESQICHIKEIWMPKIV